MSAVIPRRRFATVLGAVVLALAVSAGVVLPWATLPSASAASVSQTVSICGSSATVSLEGPLQLRLAWSGPSPLAFSIGRTVGELRAVHDVPSAAGNEVVTVASEGTWLVRVASRAAGCGFTSTASMPVTGWALNAAETAPGTAKLGWPAHSGSFEYRLYATGAGDSAVWTPTADTTALVAGLAADTEYTAEARWIDANGVGPASRTSFRTAPIETSPEPSPQPTPTPDPEATPDPESTPAPTPEPTHASAAPSAAVPASSAQLGVMSSPAPRGSADSSPTAAAVTPVPTPGPAASSNSATVAPAPARPKIAIALTARIGGAVRGSDATVFAEGLQPGTAYRIVVHSTPTVLAEGRVPAGGAIDAVVTLPADLEAGSHELILRATAIDGTQVDSRYGFTLDIDGALAATDDVPIFEKKGTDALPYLVVLMVLAIMLSTSALLFTTRLRSRAEVARRERLDDELIFRHRWAD